MGISRVILSRELSLDEIEEICWLYSIDRLYASMMTADENGREDWYVSFLHVVCTICIDVHFTAENSVV